MNYTVVETILGGIGVVLKTFSNEKEADDYAYNYHRDVEVESFTDEQMEKINNNGGYIEKGMF